MSQIAKHGLFQWTLRGKPYFILTGISLAVLILLMGVM